MGFRHPLCAIIPHMEKTTRAISRCGKSLAGLAFVSAIFLCTAFLGAEAKCAIVKTATGVKMSRNGKTLWNFEIENPEGRPFFHPLSFPSGKTFTDIRPKDHIWHLGYWFGWKYINGVNYWEPADEAMQGVEPAGLTRVIGKDIVIEGLGCRVALDLNYRARTSKTPVLQERRIVLIDPPDANGGYSITTKHRFEAKEDAVLERTPPKGDPSKGKWSGGYAGPTLRLDAGVASELAVRGSSGGKGAAEVTGRERAALVFSNPDSHEGLVFEQISAPEESRFYIWKDKRMVNASPVYAGAVALKKGQVLELAYRL